MTGERQLDPGGEDPHRTTLRVVDEHGLREAELVRDRLPPFRRHRGAVKKHPERVAPAAVLGAEDPQDVELRAISGGSGDGR